MKLKILTIFTILLAVVIFLVANYLGDIGSSSILSIDDNNNQKFISVGESNNNTNANQQVRQNKVDYKIQEAARNLEVPWSIAFTSENRVLIAERTGSIRIMADGKILEKPLIIFNDVVTGDEEGLMGLTVDPDYENNKYIYTSYAYVEGNIMYDKVLRLKDTGSSAVIDKILLQKIPAARFHAGSRLKFSPDGKLYITTGDALSKEQAQDLNSLGGKILRIESDGSIPQDNPFKNSLVYTYGHRNPQGIDWNKNTGLMVSTEHGPSGTDGPGGGDEVNIIKPGSNYGWPLVSHERTLDGAESPKIVFTPAVAPASALMYSGKMFPQFKDNLFFGGLRGEGVYKVTFASDNPEKVASYEKMKEINLGRIREIVESPSGEIWFSTSNTDGRGTVRQGDDKIYKITKK